MNRTKTIEEMFREGTPIDAALSDAEYRMAIEHRQKGIPIVVWRDGEVLHVPADEVLAELDRVRAPRQNPSTPAAWFPAA